ncbi:MAG: hypothetical protein ABI672_14210 [Vicinamibacteria bacterium]
MALLFLLSLAGLFPTAAVPFSVGWKTLTLFDLLFGAAVIQAGFRRSLRPLDRRLACAAATFWVGAWVALAVHPTGAGLRVVFQCGYSLVVFLLAAHLSLKPLEARPLILRPLGVALVIAWVIFTTENLAGISVGANLSPSLPSYIHRLGGFTGGNALILFICLGAPLVTHPSLALLGVALSGCATLSRSMMGMGVAILLARWRAQPTHRSWSYATTALAWISIALGLFAYLFAVIPVEPAQRTSLIPSLQPGSYLTVHRADVRMFASQPLVGVGPGRAVQFFSRFATPEERKMVVYAPMRLNPHSAILGLAAEQGVVGLGAFAWLMFEIYRRLGASTDHDYRRLASAALTGLLVGGHFVDWIALKGLWLWIGFIVAASASTTEAGEQTGSD